MTDKQPKRTGTSEFPFAPGQDEQLFAPALEHFTDGFFACDGELRVVAVNTAAEQLLGRRREELLGSKYTDVFPEARHSCVAEEYRRTAAGEARGFEHFYAPSGRWLQQRCLPRIGGGLFCYFLDITERKLAEEALRASEQRYRSLVEATSDLIWEVDAEGRYTFLSGKFEELSGHPAELFLGHSPLELLPDEGAEEARRQAAAVLAARRPFTSLEVPLQHSDGRVLIVELSGVPIFDVDDRYQGLRGVSRDVTRRKQDEVERRKLQQQLLHSQKMESIGRLAGGVAHDFNNMLSVILGYAEIAMDKVAVGSSLHSDLLEIAGATHRSAQITRQVLSFARREAANPQVLDLNRNVEGTLKMLRRFIGKGTELVWLPGEEVWPVRMDPAQLDQILANLCVNSRDAITGAGRITISTKAIGLNHPYVAIRSDCPPGNFVLLSVADNGCGMDEATRDRIFEPFYTTKDVGKGTGLGLATVLSIVRQNGGCIDVETVPGEGTKVSIFLPSYQGETKTAGTDTTNEPLFGGRETVLVVDDELALLKLVSRMLDELGYRVLTASSPAQAVEMVSRHGAAIDVLLTDVVMPGMNGLNLAARLRTLHPHIGLVYMSGYAPQVLGNQGVFDDGQPFLQKPFSIKELAEKILQALATG